MASKLNRKLFDLSSAGSGNVSVAELIDRYMWQLLPLGVNIMTVLVDISHAHRILSQGMDHIQSDQENTELVNYEI
jgi:hypothetical protein